MKPFVPAILALGTLFAMPTANANTAEFVDYAQVLSVNQRLQRYNEPREECYNESPRYERYDRREEHGSAIGPIIGGVAGAIIGHQVGRGSGRDVATAVGAVTGAIVGGNMSERGRDRGSYGRPTQRCRVVDNWVTRPDGFDVRYEYQGHEYSAVLPYDPGRRLRLRVALSPAE